jgi:hypothetical protein
MFKGGGWAYKSKCRGFGNPSGIQEEYTMDHRCGARHDLDLPARFHVPSIGWNTAAVSNASMSGLFLSGVQLPLRVVVTIELPVGEGLRQSDRWMACRAMVVRADGVGVGLVFDEFGPAPVRLLLEGPALTAVGPPAAEAA